MTEIVTSDHLPLGRALLTTLMSLFQGVRHERSSPDQLGSKYEAEGSRMAGGGAEDDGRANLYGAACVKRSSLPLRLG